MKKQLLAVWALFLIYPAFSQQQEEISDTLQMEEVVVTHSKIPLTRKQTTKPVQVISSAQIQESGGKDLAQVLQEQAGIFLSGAYSNPGKDKILYLQGASNDYTLILLDGQPIVDPSGLGGSFDLRLFSLQSLDRIEILPGSQSTLYGSDAIAGVINLISKKPSGSGNAVGGQIAYGSYGTLLANAGLTGSRSKIDYNLHISSHSTDGFSEAKSLDKSATFDKDGSKALGAQVNLGIRISDDLKFKPYFRFSEFEGDFDDGAFADANNKFEGKVVQTGFQTQMEGKKYYTLLHYGITRTDRLFETGFGDFQYVGRFQIIDAVFSYKLNEKVRLIANANFQEYKMLDSTATEPDPSIRIFSPSLQLLWRLNEKLNVESGFRYNSHSKFGSNSNASFSWAYWPNRNFRIFSSLTSGFKAPSLNQLYGVFGANENLNPQTSLHFEGGIGYQVTDANLSLQASYFNRKIKDVIVYDFATGYRNQNEQSDQGISLLVNGKLSEKVSFNGHYDFLTGKVRVPLTLGRDTTYSNLFRRPKHRVVLNLRYVPNSKLLFTLQGQINGKRSDLYFNPDNFFAEEAVTLDPYFLVNAYASYQILGNKLSIFLDLKNLLNADFSEVYGFNAAGIHFTGGLQFKF